MWENSVHVNGAKWAFARARGPANSPYTFDQIVYETKWLKTLLLSARERQEKDVDSWYEFFHSLAIFSTFDLNVVHCSWMQRLLFSHLLAVKWRKKEQHSFCFIRFIYFRHISTFLPISLCHLVNRSKSSTKHTRTLRKNSLQFDFYLSSLFLRPESETQSNNFHVWSGWNAKMYFRTVREHLTNSGLTWTWAKNHDNQHSAISK